MAPGCRRRRRRLIFLGAIVVSIDVLMRKLFAVTLGGADELSGYALAIGSAWAFSFALLERVNVRVDALYQRFSPRMAGLFDIFALLALAIFVGVVTWFGFDVAWTSLTRGAMSNTQLKTPLWIPQGLWFFGMAFFFSTLALLMARSVQAWLSSDFGWLRAMWAHDRLKRTPHLRPVMRKVRLPARAMVVTWVARGNRMVAGSGQR